jgi:DNA-directed RNA polymerase subunit RPC12/RpoP
VLTDEVGAIGRRMMPTLTPKPTPRPIVLKAATCTACGHLLRGLTPDQMVVVCPECGESVVFALRAVGDRPKRRTSWRGTSLLIGSFLVSVLVVIFVFVVMDWATP